jgi:hypothetical protein
VGGSIDKRAGTMWNERECGDRRIGGGEILWSWAIVAVIVISLAAWAGVEALMPDSTAPMAVRVGS